MEDSAVLPVSVTTILAVGTPCPCQQPNSALWLAVPKCGPATTPASSSELQAWEWSVTQHWSCSVSLGWFHNILSSYFGLKWVKYVTEAISFPLLWALIMPCSFMVFRALPDLCAPHSAPSNVRTEVWLSWVSLTLVKMLWLLLGASCPLGPVKLWAVCPSSIPVSNGCVRGDSQSMGMLEEDSSDVVP